MLVDPATGEVQPIGQTDLSHAYGWGPASTSDQTDKKPAGEGEVWAVDAAEDVVTRWTNDIPGLQDRTFQHKGVVRYAVSWPDVPKLVYMVTPGGVVTGGSEP